VFILPINVNTPNKDSTVARGEVILAGVSPKIQRQSDLGGCGYGNYGCSCAATVGAGVVGGDRTHWGQLEKFSCCISRVAAVVNLAAMRDNMAAMKER
jgi:hypothetical protein